MHDDEQHLTILSICHYCYAALVAALACVPLLYVAIGAGLVAAAPSMEVENAEDRFGLQILGGMFATIGLFAAGFGFIAAILKLLAGECLRRRRGYAFCFVVAVLECLNAPLGTILGVFTLVVLSRPTVRQRFELAGNGKPFASNLSREPWQT